MAMLAEWRAITECIVAFHSHVTFRPIFVVVEVRCQVATKLDMHRDGILDVRPVMEHRLVLSQPCTPTVISTAGDQVVTTHQ